jgi:Phosphotransferase enzyme family
MTVWAMSNTELPLPGGIRHGRTVRVGDTVRKPSGPWTSTVHALLQHLIANGFPAPRPLGTDDRQREILTYIEGDASIWPWPDVLRTTDGVRSVGAMLRRYHDAVSDFVSPSPCVWQDFEGRAPKAGEIVCHGDFGPYNLIWRGNEIVGVIDWEWARPASPLRDIAWAAWSFVPLRTDEDYGRMKFAATLEELRGRFLAFLAAYGPLDPSAVIDSVIGVRRESSQKVLTRGGAGIEPWKTFLDIGMPERNERDNAWLEQNKELFLT